MSAYLSLEASLHDLFWAEEGQPAEVGLMDVFLNRHPGKCLELGCGSGRLLLKLMEKGHDVAGVDNSEDMIELCRTNAEKTGLTPELHLGVLSSIPKDQTFSSVVIPAFTLQLMTDPADTLAQIRERLEPGGGLYLTTFIPWAEIVGEVYEYEWYDANEATLPDGKIAYCRTRMVLDRVAQRLERDHHYRPYDRDDTLLDEHVSTQNLTWFYQRELCLMLAMAGFNVDHLIYDFSSDSSEGNVPHIMTIYASALPEA